MLAPIIVQQRCVHHISSLCIRNMTITLASDSTSHGPADNESFLYFTLHPNSRSDKDVLFKSEIVDYSPNPTWKNIKIVSSGCGSLHSVAVRLWIGNDCCFMPAMQWELSLRSLNCIGDSLDPGRMTFHSNAVILGMHKTYYACSTAVSLHQTRPVFDFNSCRSSYKLSSLQRIFENIIETKRYKNGATQFRDNVATGQFSKNKEMVLLKSELENIRRHISHLEKVLKRERALLDQEKEIANSLKSSIDQREKKLAEGGEKLTMDRCRMRQSYKLFLNKKLQLSQSSNHLIQARQSLLSDLNLILPISQYEGPLRARSQKRTSVDQQCWENLLSICGVKLPESEDFNVKDDRETSIALGYTAQLVMMISQFLLVPLRYPIVHRGSSSNIIDLVTEKMSDRERVFPIHVRGNRERFLFNYGVFLLNKNIAHIRYLCGQGTEDVRKTLFNVNSLLDERLGARLRLGSPSLSTTVSPPPLNRVSSEDCMTYRPQNTSVDGSLLALNGPTAAVKPAKFHRSESVPSGMRVVQDPGEIASLRNELFGINESSEKYSQGDKPLKPCVGRFKRMSSTISFDKSSLDSVESITVTQTPSTCLTGLEVSGSNVKDAKLSFAAARAELLGKKVRRQSSKESWSSESVPSNTRGRQGSSSHDITKSARSSSDLSRKKSGTLSSVSSSPRYSTNVDPNDFSPFTPAQSSSVKDKNVFVFDANGASHDDFKPDIKQSTHVNHSNEEPDLC